MKSFEQLSEDIETRRAELKQKQREQGKAFKAKGADRVGAAKQKTSLLKQRVSTDTAASLDRIKQMAAQRKAAKADADARRQERENISAEIAASREDRNDEREELRKSKEKKRMSKERKREELQKTLDTVG